MRKNRDLMDWLANTKIGNVTAVLIGVGFGISLVLTAYLASA